MILLQIAWPTEGIDEEQSGWLIGWRGPETNTNTDYHRSDHETSNLTTQNEPRESAEAIPMKKPAEKSTCDTDISAIDSSHSHRTLTVAGIIPKDCISSRTTAQRFLHCVNNAYAFSKLRSYCAGGLVLLGEWVGRNGQQWCDHMLGNKQGVTWIILEKGQLKPSPELDSYRDLFNQDVCIPSLCTSFYEHRKVQSFHVILYRRPRLDHFEYLSMSSTQFELLLHQINVSSLVVNLCDRWLGYSFGKKGCIPKDECARNLPPHNVKIIENILADAEDYCRRKLDYGYSLDDPFPLQKSSAENGKSAYSKMSELSQTIKWCIWQPLIALLIFIRLGAEGVINVLNIKLPLWLPLVGGRRVRQISLLGRQLDRKCREYCTWPSVLVHLRRASGISGVAQNWYWERPHDATTHHIAVYSSMSLALLDVVLGVCFGLYLVLNSYEAGPVLKLLHHYVHITHIDVLMNNIEWLMGLPAGLKVNHAVSYRAGCMNLGAINAWNTITTILTPWEPVIAVLVGASGALGITLIFALAADILHAATLHIYVIRSIFAQIHRTNIYLLASLWRLFRGKKWNILRARVDSAEFDTPELLIGTLVFACIFFLFSTLFAYYAFFSLVWLFVLALKAALWVSLAILNRFPFYALYMRLKYPLSRPGGSGINALGTVTKLNSKRSNIGAGNMCMTVLCFPAPLSSIFHVYTDMWKSISSQYHPKKIIMAALLGEDILESPEPVEDFDVSIPTPSVYEYSHALHQLLQDSSEPIEDLNVDTNCSCL